MNLEMGDQSLRRLTGGKGVEMYICTETWVAIISDVIFHAITRPVYPNFVPVISQ